MHFLITEIAFLNYGDCIDFLRKILYTIVGVIVVSELFENAIVEKRNVLNELRSNSMTVQELRFFSIYLSKINPWDISTRTVRFPISDFQRIMGFGKLNIGQLRESTDSLLSKIIHVPDERGGYTAFTLFKRCRVSRDDNDEWFVEINASDDALPLMFDFKNRYFKYALWNALRLKSPNQIRMYEILKQYETLGKREITIVELRELIGIDKKEYSGRTGWSDFKKYVLDSCQQALKENTDICYTYERGKTGKGGKWLTIIFHITKNADYKDPLALDEFINLQPEPECPEQAEILEEEPEDEAIDYGGELADLLGETCNNEFSPDQIRILQDLILQFVGHDYIKCSDYLTHKLNITNAFCKKKDTESRHKYLVRMINNDIKNPDEAM